MDFGKQISVRNAIQIALNALEEIQIHAKNVCKLTI